jgi:hypothetical protein
MWIGVALGICCLHLLIPDWSGLLNGFFPVLISPIQKITYVSLSPSKAFRVLIVYERIGDVNYSVVFQRRPGLFSRVIYRSLDLENPVQTERVMWSEDEANFQLISRNSGLYSEEKVPSERKIFCYGAVAGKLDDCDC